jgi:hypothetical protein
MELACEVIRLGSRKGDKAVRAATGNGPLSGNVCDVMVGRDVTFKVARSWLRNVLFRKQQCSPLRLQIHELV